jgi:hypothetical protein
MGTRSRTRSLTVAAVATGALLAGATAAGACGGLVGENGSIALVRTTTLAAWHDGVEHYVTSFEFSGSGESVGSIIPLPAAPIDVVRGGDWTLQRLQLEVAPQVDEDFAAAESALATGSGGVEILLETEIDALDITVLSGGGDAVGEWAIDNGFLLTPDTPEILDFYAERSPVFLAAKFDAERAAQQGLATGQGTPIHITMEVPRPWVPLRILGLGLDADEVVQADVFLLTDEEPELLAGGRGLVVERSVPANESLLVDLRTDVGMEWVPDDLWLTHLTLDEDAGDLDYDLSATGTTDDEPSTVDAGLKLASADRSAAAVDPADEGSDDRTLPIATLAIVLGVGTLAAAARLQRRNRRAS